MKTFRAIIENRDVEEYDLEDYYTDLIDDINEDLEELRDIAKQVGVNNEAISIIKDIIINIGNINDNIQNIISNYDSEENESI